MTRGERAEGRFVVQADAAADDGARDGSTRTRCGTLSLTDGRDRFTAREYERIDGLGENEGWAAGMKIALTDPYVGEDGSIWLERARCAILGGRVDRLERARARAETRDLGAGARARVEDDVARSIVSRATRRDGAGARGGRASSSDDAASNRAVLRQRCTSRSRSRSPRTGRDPSFRTSRRLEITHTPFLTAARRGRRRESPPISRRPRAARGRPSCPRGRPFAPTRSACRAARLCAADAGRRRDRRTVNSCVCVLFQVSVTCSPRNLLAKAILYAARRPTLLALRDRAGHHAQYNVVQVSWSSRCARVGVHVQSICII